MKKIVLILLINLILIYFFPMFSFSYEKISHSIYIHNDIEVTLCPEKSIESNLTITADPKNTEMCNITLSPNQNWIKLEIYQFSLSPGQSKTIKVYIYSKIENYIYNPGKYQGFITMTSNCDPKYVEIPVIMNILEPTFNVEPLFMNLTMLPVQEKTVNINIQNGKCETTLSVSSLFEYVEGAIVGVIFQKSLKLFPYQIVSFPVKIRTNNYKYGPVNVDITFNTPYSKFSETFSGHSVQITVYPAGFVLIEGIITELEEKDGYLKIKATNGKIYKILLRDEDKGKYKIGEYIKIQGYYDDEVIYPEEIVKLECGVLISDPEDIIFCPTCPSIKYGSEDLLAENNKSIKIKVKNVGKISVNILGSIELKNKISPEDVKIEVKLEPSSISLAPNEEKEIIINVLVKENPRKMNAYFYYKLRFKISPSPPCTEEIVKDFKVTICPTSRKIDGTVKFINNNGKECALKGIRVLLFLNYEPKCGVYKDFKKHEGNFPSVHNSFNTGFPATKYYLETYTDNEGKYEFLFFDLDCKHDYAVAVIFETKEFKITYKDCTNLFFLKVNIKNEDKPCQEIKNTRDIIIGKDTDIIIPKDFLDKGYDSRAVAQTFCHMDEAFSVFRNEKCGANDMIDKSMLPINICVFSDENGTFYRRGANRKIDIDVRDSAINSNNKPRNREWHEFGHFLQDSLYGIPLLSAGDENHFGLANSNSIDSFLEGFAEVTSLFILRQMKVRETCCSDFTTDKNGIYGWGGGQTDLENGKFKSDTASFGYFDAGGTFHNVERKDVRCVGGKLKDTHGNDVIMHNSNEEFGVAGLLLDLLDGGSWYDEIKNNVVIHGKDDDGFTFPNWRELYCLMKDKNIKNIKELYDALRDKFKDDETRKKIDDIFIDHGFFQDKNFNGVRDAGEKVGVTHRCETKYYYQDKNPTPPPNYIWKSQNLPKIEEREDFPTIPQANILVHLLDETGNPINDGILAVEVISFDGRVNFSYEREAKTHELFYIYIVPNGDEILRIYMKNSNEKPLIVTEEELWNSVINDRLHVKEYTFKMVKEESLPEISLEKETFDFDSLLEGEKKSLNFSFWNSGRGTLSISLSSLNPWISVELKTFEGNAGFLNVNINTTGLKGGVNEGKIKIKGNFGEKEIKVKVNVIPKIKKTVIELFIGKVDAYINGNPYTLDSEPYIKPPGRTMVPLRFISEGLGATVDYSPKVGKVQEIYIFYKGKKITLFIGKKEALIDDRKVILDAEVEITKGRTFVPIRFIAETFGAKVDWDASTKKVTITLEE